MADIDAGWDPEKGSLDDHRKEQLKTLKQDGFGADSVKAKARAAEAQVTVAPVKKVKKPEGE